MGHNNVHSKIAVNQTSISYLWREPAAASGFATGVSLHSHTSQSKETLDFIAELSTDWAFLQPIMRWFEERSVRHSGIRPDYARSYWTPPLTPAPRLRPRALPDRELPAAPRPRLHQPTTTRYRPPLLLRSVPSARHIPVSVEWTVPFGTTAFHLGVHNLPSATGAEWMARLEAFTATPIAERAPDLLHEIPG